MLSFAFSLATLALATLVAFMLPAESALAVSLDEANRVCIERVAAAQKVQATAVEVENTNPIAMVVNVHGSVKDRSGGTVRFTCAVGAGGTPIGLAMTVEPKERPARALSR